MSVTELARFLDEERVLTCATLGPTGRPHLMPLWYVRDGPTLYAWTYGKSQKVRNLEREPRATVQIEAGRDRYGELRGATPECDGVIERDLARLADVGPGWSRAIHAPRRPPTLARPHARRPPSAASSASRWPSSP